MSDYSQERISRKPSSEEPEQKSRKGIIIVLICAVVIVAAVIAIVILLKPNKPEDEATTDSEHSRVVTEDNVDQIIKDLDNEKLGSSSYRTIMNTTWMFENGQSASSNAYIENSTSNSNAVYIDVKRSDTEDIIYSSPIIPVGSHLENIVLDENLEMGTYPCRVTYNLVDEDQNVVSTVDVNITIVIQE